jgi:two-component system response regulator GlrR
MASLLRVLVVDDEPEVAKALKRVLRASFEVQTVGNGQDALAMLDVFRPHVVVSDVRMPGMRGDVLAGEIRRRAPDIGVLLMSGDVDSEDLSHHAPDVPFFKKPWNNEVLIQQIEATAKPDE